MSTITNLPNPERIYEVIVAILERRYNVKIEYTLEKVKKEENHEQNCN